MTPEMLLALVQARGAQLDGVSGGGRPEWTLVECAFGCAGLSESRMAAFWWRYARDPTSRAIVTQVLSEEAQWIKRRDRWPDKVAGLPYLTELVEVVVAEEHMSELQRHRLLERMAHAWGEEVWNRYLARKHRTLGAVLDRLCVDGHEHISRRIREDD